MRRERHVVLHRPRSLRHLERLVPDMDEAQGGLRDERRRPAIGGADVDRLQSLSPPTGTGSGGDARDRKVVSLPGSMYGHRESVMGKVDVYAVRDGRDCDRDRPFWSVGHIGPDGGGPGAALPPEDSIRSTGLVDVGCQLDEVRHERPQSSAAAP